MDRMVNNIQLTWKLSWMLRTYRTCNSMVGFSKYEIYNRVVGDVTLLRVIPSVTWTQLYIYIWREKDLCYICYNFTRVAPFF